MLVAGIIVRVDRKDRLLYLEVCDKFDYHAASYITIASGIFIIIVSGLGLIGTLRESRSLLLSVRYNTFIFICYTWGVIDHFINWFLEYNYIVTSCHNDNSRLFL